MKRISALLLCLAMLLCLTACGGAEEEAAGISHGECSSGEIGGLGVEPGVLYSANGLEICLERIEDGYYGPEIFYSLENSTDTALSVEEKLTTVNGYVISGAFLCEVPAGQRVESSFILFKQHLDQLGITELAVLENVYYVREGYELVFEAPVEIRTELAESYTPQPISEPLIFEDENIRVYYKGMNPDSLASADLLLLIENISGGDLQVSCGNAPLVNGIEMDCLLWEVAPAGKICPAYLSFYKMDLEEAGIESIESVEMNFSYVAPDSWDESSGTWTEPYITPTVSFTLN